MIFSRSTFNTYILTTFIKWLVAMLFGLSFVIFLVDLVETLKRTQKVEMGILDAAHVSAMRIPELLMEVLPILVLFAVIGVLWWRSRSHELIVARATGLSLWKFLQPIMLASLIFGALVASVFHPISLYASKKYQELESKFFWVSEAKPVLKISSTGTWLREELGANSYRLIRGKEVEQDASRATFQGVDLFEIKQSSRLVFSWSADKMIMENNLLQLTNVIDKTNPDVPRKIDDQTLKTILGPKDLYIDPVITGDVNFWQMPARINELKSANRPYRETTLKHFKLLFLPFTLVSMVLLAAVFSLRMARAGGVGKMILAGVSVALLLHFVTDILYSFALVGTLPIILSVAAGPLILTSCCASFLLGHEDG